MNKEMCPLDVSLSLSFNGIASETHPVGLNISMFPALDTPQTLTYAEKKRHSAFKNRADRKRSSLETISPDSEANSNRFIIDFHSCMFGIQDVEAHLLYNCKLSMSTFPSTVSSVMTAGDIDHRGGVITPLCLEYHVLVYIECGQTVLYFDKTQKKKKKDPVIDPLLLPPIEILIT